jgi:hypothetical protein
MSVKERSRESGEVYPGVINTPSQTVSIAQLQILHTTTAGYTVRRVKITHDSITGH